MMIFVAALALLVLLSAIALFSAIAHDGYGSRPVPRSHPDDVCWG